MQATLKSLPAFALVTLVSVCVPTQAQQTAPLPDAPSQSMVQTRPNVDSPAPKPLTLGDRFKLEARVTFGPSAFFVPAAEAGITMAHPPHNYPREWSDGAGAFGRNYGAELARHTAGGLTRFTVAAIDREDPRYYASSSNRYVPRAVHAMLFTVSNRNMAGHRTFALSNFAGAAGAGAIGMPYEPQGFDKIDHAAQRAALEFASFGFHNLTSEFSPEITAILVKMHMPHWIRKAAITEVPNRP